MCIRDRSIEGRLEFNRMMEDIKSGKDGVSYVLVFKLSQMCIRDRRFSAYIQADEKIIEKNQGGYANEHFWNSQGGGHG